MYGGPQRYYCRLLARKGPALCAVSEPGGGFVRADDGGGNPVWIVAGAALPMETAAAVARAFARGEPPLVPFVPGLVFWEASSEFVDWTGPRPRRRAGNGLAVMLDGAVNASLASSGVWGALTHVTVSTPDWLAFVVSHPLPSLQRLCVQWQAGTASLQAVLDAHSGLSVLWLDAENVGETPELSAPQVRRLVIEIPVDASNEDALREAATAAAARWELGEDAEIVIDTIEQFDLGDPDFELDTA